MTFTTISNDLGITHVTYRPPFTAVCTIARVPFHGHLEITYRPDLCLLELMSFDRWLVDLALYETTVEGFTARVFNELCAVLGDVSLRVTARASTPVHAPIEVTIERTKGQGGK